MEEKRTGWHRHSNGGGWVEDTAQVSGDAQVYGDAWVYGNALVSGNAQVSGNALVSGNAQVSGDAQVYGDAWVYGRARVSGKAQVDGSKHAVSPVYIQGSRFPMHYAHAGYVRSGCLLKPLAWWLEHVEACAAEHGYGAMEIVEYRGHVEAIAAWMRLYGVDADEEG